MNFDNELNGDELKEVSMIIDQIESMHHSLSTSFDQTINSMASLL